ncbi:hypothetical protein CEXT_481411 [Caerostris extrusa]|uniref:Uncharacterized protein n=1 Tax=Caerostris extrusa TaxID=172846 RepID=A0AAV4WA44_CAEEX|nr:hypothetical protein CEXT_481411 [Caerostris extrusa]
MGHVTHSGSISTQQTINCRVLIWPKRKGTLLQLVPSYSDGQARSRGVHAHSFAIGKDFVIYRKGGSMYDSTVGVEELADVGKCALGHWGINLQNVFTSFNSRSRGTTKNRLNENEISPPSPTCSRVDIDSLFTNKRRYLLFILVGYFSTDFPTIPLVAVESGSRDLLGKHLDTADERKGTLLPPLVSSCSDGQPRSLGVHTRSFLRSGKISGVKRDL